MLTMERIRDAQTVLEGVAERTAMIPATGLCSAQQVYLKAENLQKTGSFKLRGAYYRISKLTQEEKARGVIACSAGNHAQGVAYAAGKEGLACTICMPEGTPISKVERTKALGANIVLVPGVYDDAYAQAVQLQKEHGYTFVHPFDDFDVMAGQATVALEILDQVPDADMVFVPVGGGGLIGGIAYGIKHLKPNCKVIGVEAAGAASMKQSLDLGYSCRLDQVNTIADGIAVKCPGDETFRLCQQYVDEIVTVKESEIASAILRLLEDYKMVAEGAGAVSVAAAMYGKVDTRGKKIVCVVSGGNVDVNIVARIISKGLKKTGRVIEVQTVLDDKPNQLRTLLDCISSMGANILSVHHDRDEIDMDIGKCAVDVVLETRGTTHAQQLLDQLQQSGYQVLQR